MESGGVGQVSTVCRTKDEAARTARGLAKAHEPSHMLFMPFYKKGRTVQTECTYA
jgi:hypothetical protein